ncbi:glycosyltransferase [Pedobacter sp. AW31-3R]|uniref:glycosyltransferase n=1 Tax=Pedobacter sp. AW31-3R TaxID=3445781 RepID=UPI003F9FB240
MKILFYPSDHSANKYGSIITEGLKSKGVELITYNNAFKNYQSFRSINVVHLNWFESLGKSTSTDIRKFIARAGKLIAFKIAGKRIVWTMHNRTMHDQKNKWLKKTFLKLIVTSADVIIVHSKLSAEILLLEYRLDRQKIIYIPHPDYIGSYKAAPESSLVKKDETKLNLLFLGAVKPYKNIELLIDVVKQFQGEVILTIAGNAKSAYKKYISEYAKDLANINLDLQFIPDDLLTSYIKNSDLLILPYDLKSSLNSGTVILAFSNAKTVICPRIGTITDLQDDSLVLSYTYADDKDHAQILTAKVQEAIAMKKANAWIFDELGNKVFQEVASHNSKVLVIDKLLQVYSTP